MVGRLDGLAGAVGADVHDRLADAYENRLGGREVIVGTTDHDRQRGIQRARLAAGHRRVEDAKSALGGDLSQLRRDVGTDAGEVDHQSAGLGAGEDALIAEQDTLHIGGVGHHDRHHVGVLDRLLDGVGGLASRLDQGRDAFWRRS